MHFYDKGLIQYGISPYLNAVYFYKYRVWLPKKLKCMNELGFQRAADRERNVKDSTGFPIRCNFA